MLLVLVAVVLLTNRPSAPVLPPVVINNTAVPPVPTLSPASIAQGELLYAQHCAKCHGATLEGAADWKIPLADGSYAPPPHDNSGHTWHHPDSVLMSIVLDGGDPAYNSKMPALKDLLTEAQVAAILDYIKSNWGKDEREYQWWMTSTRDNP